MTVTDRVLEPLVGTAMDALALNHAQALLINNPTPEVDSLSEYIDELPKYGVPASVVRDMRRLLTLLERSNDLEAQGERVLAGELENLTLTARAAARGPRPLGRMSDKDLAAAIRKAQDDGTIAELIACTPRARLTSSNLLRALRQRRATALMAALGATDHAAHA